MQFEETGLPDEPVIRKAFDVLNDGVRQMQEQFKDQIEDQIQKVKEQFRERAGDQEIPPQQEAMMEAQIRDQVTRSLDMPLEMAASAAHVILQFASIEDTGKRNNLAAAAIAAVAASTAQNTDGVLDALPVEVSTPAYEYWQAHRAVQGGQSYDFAFAEVSPETRMVTLAHMVNQASELHMMTRQMQSVQAMTGEVPDEIAVKRDTLVNLRQGANLLGKVDDGLKAVFDDTFQRVSDTYAKSQVLPPPKPKPGMGGIRVMSL